MKKVISIYVCIINKIVDIICKLFKKKEGFCKFLNKKFVRKTLPWFILVTMFGFVILAGYITYLVKFKKK